MTNAMEIHTYMHTYIHAYIHTHIHIDAIDNRHKDGHLSYSRM